MKDTHVYEAYGVDEVLAERRRQIEVKGYDKTHDKQHENFELLQAARCYIVIGPKEDLELLYPFDKDTFSRTGFPVPNNRDIVKGAALLCAELDSRKEDAVDYYLPGMEFPINSNTILGIPVEKEYRVVCDEINNTPESIKNNEMHVHIYSTARIRNGKTTGMTMGTPVDLPKSIIGARCGMIPTKDNTNTNLNIDCSNTKVTKPLSTLTCNDVRIKRDYDKNVDTVHCDEGYPGILYVCTVDSKLFNMLLEVNKKELSLIFHYENSVRTFTKEQNLVVGIPVNTTYDVFKFSKNSNSLLLVNQTNKEDILYTTYENLGFTGEESMFKSISEV